MAEARSSPFCSGRVGSDGSRSPHNWIPAHYVYPQAFVQPSVVIPHVQPSAAAAAASSPYIDYTGAAYAQYCGSTGLHKGLRFWSAKVTFVKLATKGLASSDNK
ncbi:hypothetical protein COCON_G00007780 [Conger conger]|uniref:Uncharacterized protein n=1 Tax=Conger conger TaxID=82655 RepID=A0A9Q1I7W6_CONCO|nr:hypothetical protein COCON_G00007780 [Conger conger]